MLAVAAVVAVGAMAVAASQLRPDSGPCLDTIIIQPQVNAICIAPETPSTIVFGAAGASVVVVGFLLYRRHRAGHADRWTAPKCQVPERGVAANPCHTVRYGTSTGAVVRSKPTNNSTIGNR